MPQSVYREAWLTKAVTELRPLLRDHGCPLPPRVQVSCGFPGGGSARSRIGECWTLAATGDMVNQIFVSPTLTEPVLVLATLLHELIHASDDCGSGHRGTFARHARAVGLEGKLTATVPGDELIETLKVVAAKLGKYPHGGIALGDRGGKQTTRMVKLEAECCGYVVRTTRKWIDAGLPSCPCGNPMWEA